MRRIFVFALLSALAAPASDFLFHSVGSTAAAPPSIGTCYNGVVNTVPAPAGEVVNLSAYGYAICHLRVNNATINSNFPMMAVSLTGNNNLLDLNSAAGTYHGKIAHDRVTIVGNNNKLVVGGSGGNLDICGSGNTIWPVDAFVTEHPSCGGGNIYIAVGRQQIWWWADDAGGIQGQSFFGTVSGRRINKPDTINLITPMIAAGCTSSSPVPSCATGVSTYGGGREAPASNPGGPGAQNEDIPSLGSGNGPLFRFFDCANQSNTLADFLANAHVVLPGAAITQPTPPRVSFPGWPPNLPATLSANNVFMDGPLNFTYNADRGAGNWLMAAPMLLDPYVSENASTQKDTVTISVLYGTISNNQRGCNRGPTCTLGPALPEVINEATVAIKYRPARGQTTDTMTYSVTNSGGGSYSTSFPITVAFGGLCP